MNETPNVRNIAPKKEEGAGSGKAVSPFTHSMDEFFENNFLRRWMEGLIEPYAWRRPFLRECEGSFDVFPKVDILDKEDSLLLRAEVPGIDKENLEITIAGDRLTLEGKRESKEEEKTDEYIRHETAYGRLYRIVHLPVEVVGEEAKATLTDGILEISLPKVEAVTPYKVKVA